MPVESRDISALEARQIDSLVSALLCEIKIPFGSIRGSVVGHLNDLKRILAADYCAASGMPPKPLLRDLAGVIERDITPAALGSQIDTNGDLIKQLTKTFGPREIEVRARPYRRGAGLSLRGFFCRASVGPKDKFVIFLNTAHLPGAVAATFGHELGHYIYESIVGHREPVSMFMEGAFSKHLESVSELFADSLVALAAYNRGAIKQIALANRKSVGNSREFLDQIKHAYGIIGERYSLDLTRTKMKPASRVRYLTSMIHFLKLRRALFHQAGL